MKLKFDFFTLAVNILPPKDTDAPVSWKFNPRQREREKKHHRLKKIIHNPNTSNSIKKPQMAPIAANKKTSYSLSPVQRQ